MLLGGIYSWLGEMEQNNDYYRGRWKPSNSLADLGQPLQWARSASGLSG